MAESALGADCLLPALPSWARAFPGTAEQAAAARRFIAGLLDGSPFCDDAVLILCELFTNAVLHTASGKPGGLVIVQVSRWRAGVRIAVTDQGSHSQPTISYPGSHSGAGESGNGLFIADALATHLGWHDDVSGRTVCAILGEPPPRALSPSWPPAPGQAPSFGPPAATRTTCSAQPIWPWPLADGPGQHPQGDRFLRPVSPASHSTGTDTVMNQTGQPRSSTWRQAASSILMPVQSMNVTPDKSSSRHGARLSRRSKHCSSHGPE